MRRRLSREEARLWAMVASTVRPLDPGRMGDGLASAGQEEAPPAPPPAKSRDRRAPAAQPPVAEPAPRVEASRVRPLDVHGLDSTWDRRISRGMVTPEFTLDLHGHSLEAAHARLELGLAQARAIGARLVLVITGRPRGGEAADRSHRRGAIRAKLLDWLAHGSHASAIAAVRGAHRRHGGDGAVYVVLKRER
jgi:DNA-nicking Smr family endonuclease